MFSSDVGFVYLHPFPDTHWVLFIHECCFDSYGNTPPENLSNFIVERIRYCLFSEYKVKGLTGKIDSYCASSFLSIIHFTKILGIGSKSAFLVLYYQMIQ